jgi:hypothetical protein
MAAMKALFPGQGQLPQRIVRPEELAFVDTSGMTVTDWDSSWDSLERVLSGSAAVIEPARAQLVAAQSVSEETKARTAQQFASGSMGKPIVGQYYDNSFFPIGTSTITGAANRLDLVPWTSAHALRIDQIGVGCTAVGAQGKIAIYEAGEDGWPQTLVLEVQVDLTGTGFRSALTSFVFKPGVCYWMGCRFSAAGVIRAIPVAQAISLGLSAADATTYFTVIRRTIVFASAAPVGWLFNPAERVANIMPPSIRFRAA